MTPLRGIICRVAVEPSIRLEYVLDPEQRELQLSPELSVEWTEDRKEALEMEWDEAQRLASEIGFPAHAVIVSASMAKVHNVTRARREVPPEKVFEANERRKLA